MIRPTRPALLMAVLALSACQVGAPTPEGNTSISGSDIFMLSLRFNNAAKVAFPLSERPEFLVSADDVRASLADLPPKRCRTVGSWLSCYATRADKALGVAVREDGARCLHSGFETEGFTTQVARGDKDPTWVRDTGRLATWSDFARACDALL